MWHSRRRDVIALSASVMVVTLLSNCGPVRTFSSELALVDGGYRGLVVAISDYVPQDHCNHIIHGLKSVLTEFSSVLWSATGHRASLGEVTVALPRSWRTDAHTCSLLTPLSATASPTDAHIRVTTHHPAFGSRPWTQQSEGCGRQGDYIQMGSDLLRATTNNTYIHAARLLGAEWVKFRWGVFEERGYPGDPLYPPKFRDPNTLSLRPNTCSGQEVIPPPFCVTESHIPEAPTKHNAQCIGRPAWDIIMMSQDFMGGRIKPSNVTGPLVPSIHFVQEQAARVVLVVEDTAVMNLQRRWEFVRKAVRRIVVYDLPDGAYFSLVVFNSEATIASPLSKMDSISDVRQRVGSSLPRNPSRVPESQKCVLCGLQKAMEALDVDPEKAKGASIVLLTTGKGNAIERTVDEMSDLATSRGVRVDTIIYPLLESRGRATATHKLEKLVSDTKGSAFTIMDEGVGNDSKVSMMVALMDALYAAVRHSAPPVSPGAPVLLHSKSYPGGIASMAMGFFVMDESLGPKARFSIYYYDLNHVGNTVQLTAPSGHTIASVNMQEEDGDANVIFVNIPKAERGIWQYRVENRADSHQGLIIQVTGSESENRKISLRLWTSSGNSVVNMTDSSMPVIVYAEVREGVMPILNAKVTARLQRLGTNTTGSNYDSMLIDLFDNGFGDPDITGGDGVYSRYLPSLRGNSGHYQLSVMADDNNGLAMWPVSDAYNFHSHMHGEKETASCCGSKIKYSHIKKVAEFQRSTIYGVLDILAPANGIDVVPPTRILDLRSSVNLTTHDVSLHWTAPGDDYDWDRASHYEAVLANSWSEAKAFDGKRISGMPLPLLVGTEQAVTIQVDQYDQIIYVAIRAVDEAGNRGGVSNIATIWVPHPPTTPAIITTPSILEFTSSLPGPKGQEITQPVRVAGLNLEDMVVIVGSVFGFLIIAVGLGMICYCYIGRRRCHQDKRSNEKLEGNRNVMIKGNSSFALDQNESQDSADSAVKDGEVPQLKDVNRPLSPMQSWGASRLLQEHERRFSVTSGPLVDASGSLAHYQSPQDPFPDVTLSAVISYPNSETPSTSHSDPPAYQPPYTTEAYAPYPYPSGFNHDELPPYTPTIVSSQSSQASTVYTHEIPSSQPSENSYQADCNSYPSENPSKAGEISYCQAQPFMYVKYPDDGTFNSQAQLSHSKVPPPVAPKPPHATRAAAVAAASSKMSVEPKRRNITQV